MPYEAELATITPGSSAALASPAVSRVAKRRAAGHDEASPLSRTARSARGNLSGSGACRSFQTRMFYMQYSMPRR
jgi:hypothetical protein